jgi:hypothetical protein
MKRKRGRLHPLFQPQKITDNFPLFFYVIGIEKSGLEK